MAYLHSRPIRRAGDEEALGTQLERNNSKCGKFVPIYTHKDEADKKEAGQLPVCHVGALPLGFQNCTNLPRRLVLPILGFFLSASLSSVTSMDSLLLSPCELLISLLRLARLDLRLPKAAEDTERGRGSRSVGCDIRACGTKVLSRVVVELLDVSEGMS
jgi:hypothetical protein